MSNPSVLYLISFVIAALFGCDSPQKPPAAKVHLVRDMVSRAAADSLCDKVTPSLLRAVAKVETQSNADKARFEVSYMNKVSGSWDEIKRKFEDSVSHGEYQIMGKTARAYGVEPDELRKDKETSTRLAALILGKEICTNFKGNVKFGIAAFNAGPTWQRKTPKIQAQAISYANKVLKELRS